MKSADAGQEQAPVAEEVAEPPAEQQEAAEREQVGVDDPRERRLGEPEILSDRRQRDVHDRDVEHDHQVAQAEDVEREPSRAAVRWSLLPFRLRSQRFDRGSAPELIGADEFRRARV